LASTIIWHAVEFSRIGRTPSPARQGRSRGNSSNLARPVLRVKPGASGHARHEAPDIGPCSGPCAVSRDGGDPGPAAVSGVPLPRGPWRNLRRTSRRSQIPCAGLRDCRAPGHSCRSAHDLDAAYGSLSTTYDDPTPVEQLVFPHDCIRVGRRVEAGVVDVRAALGDRPARSRP
jgi:hypothetical protein